MRRSRRSTEQQRPPIDPTLLALAGKIVQRASVGRRWFFHNGTCIAFFHAEDPT